MDGILRRPIAWMGLAVALGSASLQADEPSFSLADYVHTARQAPSPSTIQCDDFDFDCDRPSSRRFSKGCAPTWNVYVGAVFLTRDRPDAGVIIGSNPPNGGSFSRGSDFDFNTQEGIDVMLRRRFANGDQLEGRYFGIDGNTAAQQLAAPGNFIGTGFTGPGGTAINGSYESNLQSAEINWRRPLLERITVLAGFRYIGLDDTLNYTLNSTVAGGLYDYENDLYGGQIGGDWSLLDPARPLELHVIGKAGIYGNNSTGNFTTDAPVGNPIQFFGRGESSTAFAGDLQLVSSYRFTRHIALRGGYQMLWLDNVALAGDNASASQLNPSLLNTHLNDNGHVFYHGAMLGAEFMW
jgi:hypothetical protein